MYNSITIVIATISTLLLGILTKRAIVIANAVTNYWVPARQEINFASAGIQGSKKYFSFRGGIDTFTSDMPLYEILCKSFIKNYIDIRFDSV